MKRNQTESKLVGSSGSRNNTANWKKGEVRMKKRILLLLDSEIKEINCLNNLGIALHCATSPKRYFLSFPYKM